MIYYRDKLITQHCGDALTVLRTLEGDSSDLLCTDPPYGIGFMGKDWDKALPDKKIWAECLRVLKPGSFAFVMSIPRADCQSRMIISLEDAGFRTNFTPIYWAYASGFPKAQNIGKAVDKRLGAEREVIGREKIDIGIQSGSMHSGRSVNVVEVDKTIATSPQAKALDGSYGGFQPKPAVEVIIVAMKPLSEKTYVDQALKNRHGITWLDSCRIPYDAGDSVFDVLLKACDTIQGSVLPTISCNKNYINRVLRVGDSDYTLDKELRRLALYPQDYEAGSELREFSIQDSQYDCPACHRFYDELTHLLEVCDQDVAPSLADVLSYIHQFSLSHKHIQHYQCNALLSNGDALLRILLGLVLDCSSAYSPLLKLYYNYTSNANKSQVRHNRKRNEVNIYGGGAGIPQIDLMPNPQGRFPANLLVSDDVLNDGRVTKSTGGKSGHTGAYSGGYKEEYYGDMKPGLGDSGSFSRYFDLDKWAQKTFPFLMVPKASKSEKNKGLGDAVSRSKHDSTPRKSEAVNKSPNNHPTVKPLKLMAYLITLGSRPGDTVIDPFGGTGTTALASELLDRYCIIIENKQSYCKISAGRYSASLMGK